MNVYGNIDPPSLTQASLGAIIVTALFGLYLQVFDLKNLFRTSTYDGVSEPCDSS